VQRAVGRSSQNIRGIGSTAEGLRGARSHATVTDNATACASIQPVAFSWRHAEQELWVHGVVDQILSSRGPPLPVLSAASMVGICCERMPKTGRRAVVQQPVASGSMGSDSVALSCLGRPNPAAPALVSPATARASGSRLGSGDPNRRFHVHDLPVMCRSAQLETAVAQRVAQQASADPDLRHPATPDSPPSCKLQASTSTFFDTDGGRLSPLEGGGRFMSA
jgi:hypothetical protein